MGEILLYGDERTALEISGVAAEQPENAHFHFDYLLSLHTNPSIKRFEWSWIWTQIVTYIKLSPEADITSLEQKLGNLAKRYAAPTFSRFGMDFEDFVKRGQWDFYLQPVSNIHLHSVNIGNRLGPVSDITYVYIFSISGFFILLIAAINFINLSTARGSTRAREVGVKKALGANRRSLMFQFQLESILMVATATLLGLGIMELFRWALQLLLHFQMPFVLGNGGLLLWVLPLLVLLVGFLAGLYPSFYLTSFRPVQVLKGKLSLGLSNAGLRNGLVVIQFTIAIALLATTLLVYQQIQYFMEKDLGFENENLLVVNHAEKLGNHLKTYKNEISKYPGVVSASISMDVPGRGTYEDIFTGEGTDVQVPIALVKIDESFIKTLGLELAVGRSFDIDRVSDKHAVILNETAVGLLGWEPEKSIGKHIIYTGDDVGPLEVIGVVKDFHFQSLRQDIGPMVFLNIHCEIWGAQRVLAIKYHSGQTQQLVQAMDKGWHGLVKATPFEFSFYKEEWDHMYESESRLAGLFGFFTILTMMIAVIGLVGLVSYSVEQRRREIGIRKVLGASIAKIIGMMNRQYIQLIGLGLVLATPLAWWALQRWLSNFAYHIEVSLWIFLFAGVCTLTVALGCVGYLSLRAAMLNPAHVLKEE